MALILDALAAGDRNGRKAVADGELVWDRG
jgi:hypothetical protein